MDPVIIVGTGLAGYNLAKEFRKADKEQPLLLLTFDDGRNYSKPMLSTGFTKDKTADQLAMADAETMATQLNAEVRTGVHVSGIDTAAQTLQLDCGDSLSYSQLLKRIVYQYVPLFFISLHLALFVCSSFHFLSLLLISFICLSVSLRFLYIGAVMRTQSLG